MTGQPTTEDVQVHGLEINFDGEIPVVTISGYFIPGSAIEYLRTPKIVKLNRDGVVMTQSVRLVQEDYQWLLEVSSAEIRQSSQGGWTDAPERCSSRPAGWS